MDNSRVTDLGTFDYVIVGAGSAGCVLANRLSADPSIKVLLLEAGGKDSSPWVAVPVGYARLIGNPKYDWCFWSEPNANLDGRVLSYPRGKVLGGSSTINGHIYIRGQAADYDTWRELGNVTWGWSDVLPYFKKSEDWIGGSDELHSAGGPLPVTDQRNHMPLLDTFIRAAAECGIPITTDFNRGRQRGVRIFSGESKERCTLQLRHRFSETHPAAPEFERGYRRACHADQIQGQTSNGRRCSFKSRASNGTGTMRGGLGFRYDRVTSSVAALRRRSGLNAPR